MPVTSNVRFENEEYLGRNNKDNNETDNEIGIENDT